MSITFDIARNMVEKELNKISDENGEECIISSIKEFPSKGWVFGYNTKNFLIEKKFAHALAGNLPIFVSANGDLNYISIQDSPPLGEYNLLFAINS